MDLCIPMIGTLDYRGGLYEQQGAWMASVFPFEEGVKIKNKI